MNQHHETHECATKWCKPSMPWRPHLEQRPQALTAQCAAHQPHNPQTQHATHHVTAQPHNPQVLHTTHHVTAQPHNPRVLHATHHVTAPAVWNSLPNRSSRMLPSPYSASLVSPWVGWGGVEWRSWGGNSKGSDRWVLRHEQRAPSGIGAGHSRLTFCRRMGEMLMWPADCALSPEIACACVRACVRVCVANLPTRTAKRVAHNSSQSGSWLKLVWGCQRPAKANTLNAPPSLTHHFAKVVDEAKAGQDIHRGQVL